MDLYPFGAWLFRVGFRVLDLDIRSVGHEHIPRRGGAIIASNHIGYLDFAFVALAPPPPRRRVRFVARREVFAHPLGGPLMRALGQIEADPYGQPSRALDHAIAKLQAGEVVGIHPEGTISPSFVPRRGRSGTVRMARDTGVPIVPCAVWGSQRLLTKWRPRSLERGIPIEVHYGEPFHVDPDEPASAETDRLMGRIRDLLADAQAAYPEEPGEDSDRWWLPAHLGGTALTPDEAERRLREQHAERARQRREELRARPDD